MNHIRKLSLLALFLTSTFGLFSHASQKNNYVLVLKPQLVSDSEEETTPADIQLQAFMDYLVHTPTSVQTSLEYVEGIDAFNNYRYDFATGKMYVQLESEESFGKVCDILFENYGDLAADTWLEGDVSTYENAETGAHYELHLDFISVIDPINDRFCH